MTRQVGLFGGSFDPVHAAHVALAEAALAELALDEIRWIPAGQPWQKERQLAPAADREAMVRLAIAHEPRFVLDRIELDRAGPSYTVDTVQALAAAEPGTQWFLIIGQDQVAGLHTWKDWRALLDRVVLAVAHRPGELRLTDPEVLRMRQRVVPLAMQDTSSTAVRRRVAEGGDISKLVPPAVARYIDSQGLYRAPPRS
jgi:nicotinate-nucleotide adenylyltransferase